MPGAHTAGPRRDCKAAGVQVKIEWLNDEMTHASIIVGWFRKRMATVERRTTYYDHGGYWVLLPTGRRLDDQMWSGSARIETVRDREYARRAAAQLLPKEWTPLTKPPKARLLLARLTGGW